MKVTFSLILIVLFGFFQAFGQNRMVFSGFVYDQNSREVLVGATVLDLAWGKGVITNAYGFYSLIVDSAEVSSSLRASFVGYLPSEVLIASIKTSRHDFFLSPGLELSEVTVTAGAFSDVTKTTEVGVTRIPIQDIKMLPNLFGEVDIIKAFQMTPGVQSGGEARSDLFVRGSSPDQNLVLLDDVPLYYVAHFGGFFSIFNSDAISDVRLIKGGFPARYGGRLSSVLEVRMRDGNMNKFQGQGAVGLLSSKLMLEGPLAREKSSFMISARGSLIPVYKLLFLNVMTYNFYDLNAKLNFKLSGNDRLLFSLYAGDDIVVSKNKQTINQGGNDMKSTTGWGNMAAAVRYNKVFSNRLFGNMMLAYSRYRYTNGFENSSDFGGEESFRVKSSLFTGISDLILKTDLSFNASPTYSIRFGASTIHHSATPNDEDFFMIHGNQEVERSFNSLNRSLESAVYIENEIKFGKSGLNFGLRGVYFLMEGKSYTFFEPRVNINMSMGDEFSLKGAYSLTNQFMHLLSYSGAGMPTDYWMPSTANVKPARANQYNLGVAKSFGKGGLQLTLEGYWKDLDGMVTFRPGASLIGNLSSWENVIEREGKGTNYGAELFLQKTSGRSTGWVGITLSRAKRQFENLNGGLEFPFKYDRLLDISFVWNFMLSEKISISTAWSFGTGYPVTLANERYYLDVYFDSFFGLEYNEVFYYSEINSFRMRNFHRLDMSLNHTHKTSWGESTWSFSIFNVYNRKNPYYYYYERSGYMPTHGIEESFNSIKLKQRSLFPFFPSVSYNFKF